MNPLLFLLAIPPGWLALPAIAAFVALFSIWDEVESRRREGRPLSRVTIAFLLGLGIPVALFALGVLIRAVVL